MVAGGARADAGSEIGRDQGLGARGQFCRSGICLTAGFMTSTLAILFCVLAAGMASLIGIVEIDKRRIIAVLASIPCPRCGKPFGKVAAIEARELHIASCQQIRRQHPDRKINFEQVWRVNCPSCGGSAKFDTGKRQLELQAV